MVFPPPVPEKKPLGTYRVLAPNASIRVSPICLGGMNFGNSWESLMGKCDKKSTFEVLDYYYKAGGNFVDTANNYQDGESEEWIGDWMEERKNRDQMVIATKYTMHYRAVHSDKEVVINTGGNGTKSLRVSLNASLEKLKTDYIDLLYVHWWDFTVSIPELMQSLNVAVNQGKVLYLGVSDTPAWVVSKANEYARQNGLRQFSVYQGRWSAEHRDFERDIVQMCAAEGMGLAPWGALGSGTFKSDAQRKSAEGRATTYNPTSEATIKISKALEKIASNKKTLITSVALAYVRQKAPYVFPIVGGRKIEHLKGNIEALSVQLTQEEMDEIEGANAFDLGFPLNFLGGPKGVSSPSDVWFNNWAGYQEHVAWPKAIENGNKA